MINLSLIDKVIYEAAVKEAVLQATAIVAADMETGEILYTSPPADVMFGYSEDELIGKSVDELLPPDLRANHEEYRKLYAEAPRARPMGTGMILRGWKKDGSEFPIQVSLSPIKAIDRRLVIAAILDLTQPVKAAVMIQHVIDDAHSSHPPAENGT